MNLLTDHVAVILQFALLESVVAQAVVPVVAGELAYFVASPVAAAFVCQVAKRLVRHRDKAQQHLGVLVSVRLPVLCARVSGDVGIAELCGEVTEATADSVQQRSCDLTEGFGLHFTQRLDQVVEHFG
ncbi:short-chain dehydrogenase reductase SDR, putative [Babesia ovata]|uniref:Short-chain dehydrogenase reductase SDR, putative n=1 Tax=Babesia ovata TaxID=189622 RepID=A0A2H6K8I7_9APIC|nr:short-chain dehydrogenase reductase SDR, putative [Babesia ovata]GBE59288.1 short-chain dehydrogenase reductase SDR, putative [Babesia ovata]